MAISPICAVQVGTHTEPYWIDARSQLIVCNRHMHQNDERPDLGRFNWEEIGIVEILSGGEETTFETRRN